MVQLASHELDTDCAAKRRQASPTACSAHDLFAAGSDQAGGFFVTRRGEAGAFISLNLS